MILWCFDDRQSWWGRQLVLRARVRNIDARLFTSAREVLDEGYVFYRMEQGKELEKQRQDALVILDKPGIIGIQNREDVIEYEDKAYQQNKYASWFPRGWYFEDQTKAAAQLRSITYPFISKSKTGSGSASVRVIRNESQARRELDVVFSRGLNVDRGVQKGYALWQEFLPDNKYAYRVVKIGTYYFMLKVFNREDIPLASGSGKFMPITPRSEPEMEAFQTAVRFMTHSNTNWCGVDLLYDFRANEWKVIETTLAWNLHTRGANMDCQFVNYDGAPLTPRQIGAGQFDLLLDEMDMGVWLGQ